MGCRAVALRICLSVCLLGSVDVWHIASVLMKSNRRYPPTGDAILAGTGGLWPPLGAPRQCLMMLRYLSAFADSALGNLEGGSGCRLVVDLGCTARSTAVGALRS